MLLSTPPDIDKAKVRTTGTDEAVVSEALPRKVCKGMKPVVGFRKLYEAIDSQAAKRINWKIL